MPMSSHEIGAMAMQQQAMFGNFQSYAQQITPPYASGGASQMSGNPMSGYGQSPPSYQPMGGGFMTGPPPAPPPMMAPQSGMMMPQAGGLAQMAMRVPYSAPGSYVGQAFGEQLAGTAMGGFASGMQGAGALAGMAGMAGAGMSALGVGGVAAGGLAMAGSMPITMGLAAGAYGAQQMYGGFQQRQQVNSVLRQRFGGMMGVGSGRGGMGFSTGEMGDISSMMRDMSGDDMFTGFDELTRVMDKTAQMGMYRGVQSAKQFREKFKQTVASLKEVAQTMHTSLEEATQFMGQQRQMGFFSGAEINQNLMKTKMTAGATGLSVGQLNEAGMQGTQMGRAMGMLGKHGAQAMQETTANLAMGMRTGAISTELIAEATGGLTGAEGAQAAAGRMMQINQKWLRRGVGRVELAALWDPEGGGINQERLAQVRSGAMSFQEMRRLGRQTIAKTGGRRSQFFLDEERLRGQAMAEGGGDLMLGALKSHLGKRGVGMDSPIAQRWLQRQTGMSRSEADLWLEQAREMPRTMEQRRVQGRVQMENEARTRNREGRGVSGARRKWSNWWENNVENRFRQIGDDLTTSFSETVESVQQDMEGSIKLKVSKRVKQAVEELAKTGKGDFFKGAMEWQAGLDLAGGHRSFSGGAAGALGRALGTRPDSVEDRLNRLGVNDAGTALHGEYFQQVVRPVLQTGQALKGGGIKGRRHVDMTDKIEWLRKQSIDIGMGGSQFGFSSADLGDLGESARGILVDQYGSGNVDAYRAMDVKRRSALDSLSQNDSSVELQGFLDKRIRLYSQSSPELRRAFAKAKGANQKRALLREIESRAGLAEGDTRLAPVNAMTEAIGGASNENLGALIEASKNQQKEMALNLAEEIIGGDGGEWIEEKEWASVRRNVLGQDSAAWGGKQVFLTDKDGKKFKRKFRRSDLDSKDPATIKASAAIRKQRNDERRFAEGLVNTFADESIRTLTSEALKGDKDAIEKLYDMGVNAKTDKKDKETILKIVQSLKDGTESQKKILRNMVAGEMFGEIVGAYKREADTGRALAEDLTTNENLQEAMREAGPEAESDLAAIAEARQEAYKGGRINQDALKKAYKLEREFYARYGGDEKANRMIGALSKSGSGVYMSVGLERAQEVLTRAKGKNATRELLEYGLRERLNVKGGLASLGLSEKDAKALVSRMEGGEALTGKEFRAALGKKGRKAFRAVSNKQIEEAMGDIFQSSTDGWTDEEKGALAGSEAAGASSRGRQQGAGGTIATLAQKQVDHLSAIVKSQKALIKVVGAQKGMTDEQVNKIVGAMGGGKKGNAAGTVDPTATPAAED